MRLLDGFAGAEFSNERFAILDNALPLIVGHEKRGGPCDDRSHIKFVGLNGRVIDARTSIKVDAEVLGVWGNSLIDDICKKALRGTPA